MQQEVRPFLKYAKRYKTGEIRKVVPALLHRDRHGRPSLGLVSDKETSEAIIAAVAQFVSIQHCFPASIELKQCRYTPFWEHFDLYKPEVRSSRRIPIIVSRQTEYDVICRGAVQH
jgi:hypothetical protein